MMPATTDKRRTKLAIDALVVTKDGKIVLVRRKFFPFVGRYAIPGGFMEYGETSERACAREAFEETGLIFIILPRYYYLLMIN